MILSHGDPLSTTARVPEDKQFRQQLMANPDGKEWNHVYDVTGEEGGLLDRLRVCEETTPSHEGFRLLWYHSTKKAERDAISRASAIERASKELATLQQRLAFPQTRFRQRGKAEVAATD